MNSPYNRIVILFPFSMLLVVFIAGALLTGCAQESGQGEAEPDRETLYQVSTLGALKAGFYDGDVSYTELEKRGDVGIGTFEGLDGEMIALDGAFYQIKNDGKVYEVSGSALAPFAMITFFDADLVTQPGGGLNYQELQAYLDTELPSPNIFYAIKIEGRFDHVQARSVPAQEKPYPPLSEAIANQAVFELDDVEGTMVGFWCPAYVGDINAPGYHLHFITADCGAGGHVLDLRLGEVTVFIDETPDFLMQLPEMEEFQQADLEPSSQPSP
ncbi:MAG: acetolactate decarboxylase [Actinobacteria bacterium]|jgi:acetolactate decarboxylase|nr:MAG: acetolactate decarboxylase [Actinomycetota bacterium]